MTLDEEQLRGGVANIGQVVRSGTHVLRPANAHSETIHAFLRHLRSSGFDGVPEPVSIDGGGRERLSFIDGDVPYPPFPAWSQTDEALASTAALLARFHDAASAFTPPEGASWSDEMADPEGGTVICHNDVCPENVVYRRGEAVALLDFDFAAPGRPIYDLAQLAKMCVPLDAPEDAARLGRGTLDPFHRLRLVADSYGLPAGREDFLEAIATAIAVGERFVRRHVDRGEPGFVEMWRQTGGSARLERRRAWFRDNRRRFAAALG